MRFNWDEGASGIGESLDDGSDASHADRARGGERLDGNGHEDGNADEQNDPLQSLRQNARVMGALCGEYDNLFLIDVETERYVHFQSDLSGMHKPVLDKTLRCSNYHDGLLAYIDEYVADEDKDRLRRHTTTEAFLAETPETGINAITYRRIYEGKSYYYQLCSAKYTGNDGKLYLVLGFRNASPIVEAEQRKSAELATMQAIIEAAEMGTWRIELIEGERPRLLADARMLELLGLDRNDTTLSPEDVYDAWFSRIKPDAVQSVLDSVSRMEAGMRDENTYLWIHPTLGERYVRCGGTGMPIEGGHRLRGYHYDVDELVREKARQDKLLKDALLAAEHANNAKTTFLNNMSHDIRTPMNAIMGYTELAEEHIDNKHQVIDYLEKISVSSSHLLSLINDVLDMSRIESGKVVIKERETGLPEILHDIRTIMQANVKARRLSFLIDARNIKHETAICDSLRLQQVLLNLLSNAVKFTQPGGTIGLYVDEKPGRDSEHALYEFCVHDSGIGITKEFQEHIFEPFTREESATVSGIQGTGLGLAISKNIVDMMGGDISVESSPGCGSKFTVSLECKVGITSADTSEIEELRDVRALVADDDSATAISVSNMLKSIGMRTDWTLSGKEAVLRANVAADESDAYGAYIIDWQMPDMNGLDTVRRIRRYAGSDSVPIIILTAYDWGDIEEDAREAGVTAFVSKPIFMSELRGILCETLNGEGAGGEHDGENPTAAQIAADSDIAGTKILLVEDNEMNREIGVAIFSQRGVIVQTASDGDKAIEIIRSAKPGDFDMVLMDIQMPHLNGYEATRAIRALPDAKLAKIPIIAMTANAFEEDRALAREAGMDGYLVKPIEIHEAVEVIRRFTRR